MARPIYTAILAKSRWLSDQTRHFEWQVAELDEFKYTPGQFVAMVEEKDDGKPVTRAYSIASAPDGKQFDLCLNRVAHGFFSNFLCDLPEGATVKFHGPHGHFSLREPLRDSMFISTGTGIAPMRAYVQWLFGEPARHQGKHFWFIFGTRYEKDCYYHEEMEALAAKFPNFHYSVTVSRPTEAWKGRKGYVQEIIKEVLAGRGEADRRNMDAYICGLNQMVMQVRDLLAAAGWTKEQIVFERYD